MSRRQLKTAASSGRAIGGLGGFGSGHAQTSTLSFVQEPLEYTILSGPALIVIVKNLSKKDETTKTKALDDILSYLIRHPEDFEHSIADLWVRLFPRLSIDENRRVRQLSQAVNGKLCQQLGKKSSRYLPDLIGPWLAAQYDNDKQVARAAREAFNSVFTDATKRSAVWKVFAKHILDYCRSAILTETVNTLSDERVVSPRDAQLVYVRTISGCLQLVATFVEVSDNDKIDTMSEDVQSLFEEKTIALSIYEDAAMRRSTHRLMLAAIRNVPKFLEDRQKLLSNYYVYKALASDQQESSIDYINALVGLSSRLPDIWTQYYSGKRTPGARLSQFLEKGSQNGSPLYWVGCSQLLESIPFAVTHDSAATILFAVRKGACSRPDLISNTQAWRCYLEFAQRSLSATSPDVVPTFFEQNVSPLISNFAIAEDDADTWHVTGSDPSAVFNHLEANTAVAEPLLQAITVSTTRLIDCMRASQPEQSQQYKQSQDQLAKQCRRQTQLLDALSINTALDDAIHDSSLNQVKRILESALKVLLDRKGKPYGVVEAIDGARATLASTSQSSACQDLLDDFGRNGLPELIYSPSAQRLIKIYELALPPPKFAQLFMHLIHTVSSSNLSAEDKLDHVIKLAGSAKVDVQEVCQQDGQLQSIIRSNRTNQQATQAIASGIASKETIQAYTKALILDLNEPEKTLRTLERLNSIALQKQGPLLREDVQLLASILELQDNLDGEVAALARSLASKLSLDSSSSVRTVDPSIVRRAIGDESLSAYGIVELAHAYLGDKFTVETLLSCATANDWMLGSSKVNSAPDSSLSIYSPLAGAVHLVKGGANNHTSQRPLRLAICISQLLPKVQVTELSSTEIEDLASILRYCSTILATCDDQLSILPDQSAHEDMLETITSSISTISTFVQQLDASQFDQMFNSMPASLPEDDSPLSFYTSLTKYRWVVARDDQSVHVKTAFLGEEKKLSNLHIFELAALLACELPAVYQSEVLALSNHLVSSITSADLGSSTKTTQEQLLKLALCLASNDEVPAQITKQRIVFLSQHLLKSFASEMSSANMENALIVLRCVITVMADVYGEHWLDTLTIISTVWNRSMISFDLPCVYASVKLFNKLDNLSHAEDANEDLSEAMKEQQSMIAGGLVNLLLLLSEHPASSRPFELLCTLLSRTINTLETVPTVEEDLIYPLLYATSPAIQQVAFGLLSAQIRSSIETVSIEAVLSKKAVRLPNALLSLILNVPTIDLIEESDNLMVQTYLNGWRLVFQHMQGASLKVQSDYAEQLKEGQYVPDLLTLIFAGLGLSRGKPVDLTGHDLSQYEDSVTDDKKRQRLLGHLLFLALRYLPTLVKSYTLGMKARQLPAVVESWTAKYISPVLIAESLAEVAKWAQSTVEQDPDYERMQVSVGSRSKEINVKYVVDEQTMAIKVILPEAFPLTPAQVIGINRVAVKEDKWQSWLRNCQGVITFSNGSIIDGLSAWSRNVSGALKGQTECAICYSIIGADKQLPTKRCPTCKNLFHSSCLFKWFKTSNASTCPLCRNPFNFN